MVHKEANNDPNVWGMKMLPLNHLEDDKTGRPIEWHPLQLCSYIENAFASWMSIRNECSGSESQFMFNLRLLCRPVYGRRSINKRSGLFFRRHLPLLAGRSGIIMNRRSNASRRTPRRSDQSSYVPGFWGHQLQSFIGGRRWRAAGLLNMGLF